MSASRDIPPHLMPSPESMRQAQMQGARNVNKAVRERLVPTVAAATSAPPKRATPRKPATPAAPEPAYLAGVRSLLDRIDASGKVRVMVDDLPPGVVTSGPRYNCAIDLHPFDATTTRLRTMLAEACELRARCSTRPEWRE